MISLYFWEMKMIKMRFAKKAFYDLILFILIAETDT